MPTKGGGAKKPAKAKKPKKGGGSDDDDGGGGGMGGSVAELIQKKKMVVYSYWLDLTNLSLVLLGTALELIAAWFSVQYGAGAIAGDVAFGGLMCQALGVLGYMGSPDGITNGVPQGGDRTMLFAVRLFCLRSCAGVRLTRLCTRAVLGNRAGRESVLRVGTADPFPLSQ